jgi:hypothetical protein
MSGPVDILNALGHDNPTPQYEPVGDDRVPMERWGKDHWSTFAYLEVRIVDHKGRIAHDHMRCHMRRHPAMHAAKRRAIAFGPADGSQYPTKLRDGELPDHDDYDCVDDMIAAGLVTVTMPPAPAGTLVTGLVEAESMTRAAYALTPGLGQPIAAQLRAHKGIGGKFSTFTPEVPTVTDSLITVSLPGIADQIMKDGSYPADEPERWQRYRANRTIRNIGTNGVAAIVVLSRRDWSDVLDYLGGYLECVEGMTRQQRGDGGRSELRALRVAVARIGAAMDEAK